MSERADGLRLAVRKTYKLYIGGAFPRSESGRSYVVSSRRRRVPSPTPRSASRKDLRDAVVAARKAQPGWSAATAYNRGQVLYRVAEMLEGRRAQFVDELAAGEGLDRTRRQSSVDASDRPLGLVRRLGGQARPGCRVGEPGGRPVLQFLASPSPRASSACSLRRLLAPRLVSVLAPVITSGNAAVVIASEARPLPALDLAEVLGDLRPPGGVVNILSGRSAELAPVLAAHRDVDAIDLAGGRPDEPAPELERAAADNVKRVLRRELPAPDWTAEPGPARMLFLEIKTVWHPLGV